MPQAILDVIVTKAAAICWEEYQKNSRMPMVDVVVEGLLRECGLQAASDEQLKSLARETSQRFQNMLLRSRFADNQQDIQ